MKKVNNDLNIDSFLQKLSNGKKVLDFHKIHKVNFPIVFINSERGGKGKTFNSKTYALDRFKKYGETTLWLRNLGKDIDGEKTKFLEKMRQVFFDNWSLVKFSGSRLKNSLWLEYDKKLFMKFQALNTAENEKGSRVIYDITIFDEFNVNSNRVPDYINKFDSLLHSGEDIVLNANSTDKTRLYIFGNNKTLNHPLFYNLGIYSITQEITTYIDDWGNPLILMITPEFSEVEKEEINKQNKNNWRFSLSKEMGTLDHSYFNKNLYDTFNSIVVLCTEKLSYLLEPKLTIYHKKTYINIYGRQGVENGNGGIHAVEVAADEVIKNAEGTPKIYTLQSVDKLEGASHNLQAKAILVAYLRDNKMSFENVYSREIFLSAIK